MSPSHSRKSGGRLYRYYVNQAILKSGAKASPADRIPAAEVESAIIDQIRGLLRSPEIIIGTWRNARREIRGLAEAEVRDALSQLDPIWDELFPTEQARIIQLLVARIDVDSTGLECPSASGRVERSRERAFDCPKQSRRRMSIAPQLSTDGKTLRIRVPMKFTKRGGRKLIVTPINAAQWEPPTKQIDKTIVKALARGFRWRRMLESGDYGSISELAKAEKINQSYLCRMMRLTLLSPRYCAVDHGWKTAANLAVITSAEAISEHLGAAAQFAQTLYLRCDLGVVRSHS